MQVSFDDFQKALVNGYIDIHQFLEVLVDNFGQKQAMNIIEKNLKPYIKEINDDSSNVSFSNCNNFSNILHN